MTWLQIYMYAALTVFVIGTGWKMVRIARMPVHLRWDLYPIPHEKGRAHYGGSYYEEIDWWTKPQQTSRSNELRVMAKEIFFIQSLFHHNRPLWLWSFPFHIGLYLMVAFVLLLVIGGILDIDGMALSLTSSEQPALVVILSSLAFFCGLGGSILTTLGALGLCITRVVNSRLRTTSLGSDYFNLVLLAAIGASLLVTQLGSRDGLLSIYFFVKHLLTFQPAQSLPPGAAAHILLAGIFLFWLPMTHMTHFVGKYFTYHRVRWEDHPNLRGGKIEAALSEALGQPITWSAPHIKGKTWAEAAADDSAEDNKL